MRKNNCRHHDGTTLVRGLAAPDQNPDRLRCAFCGRRIFQTIVGPLAMGYRDMPWRTRLLEFRNRNIARECARKIMWQSATPPQPPEHDINNMVIQLIAETENELAIAATQLRPLGERHASGCLCLRCKNTQAHGND